MTFRVAGCVLSFYLVAAIIATLYILHKRSQLKPTHNHNDNKHSRKSNIYSGSELLARFHLNSLGLGESHYVQPLPPVTVDESSQDRKYWNQWAPINFSAHYDNRLYSQNLRPKLSYQSNYVVDIWSNNGFGEYIWQHLLKGELRVRPDKLYQYGEKNFGDIKYRYKGGDNLDVAFLPDSTEHLVLVLNARDNITASTAQIWLNGLTEFDFIQNVGLVLIGDELCDNSWLLPYLQAKNRTSLKFVFLVYDSPLVNNHNVHQFPLGVATYRHFPLPAFSDIVVPGRRKYVCNFMGTVYPNSSREHLASTLSKIHQIIDKQLCYVKTRQLWQPQESTQSLTEYVAVLQSSDLTLCPVGKNSESYRIYEAMSVGSLPVVEDVTVADSCASTPFRLLKLYKAPVIFIKSWAEIQFILERELKMAQRLKEARRAKILRWYERFRAIMGHNFTHTVSSLFFHHP